MKFRQYKNGNKFIVFDSSDSPLLPEKAFSLLKSSSDIENVIDNGSSLQIIFCDKNISDEAARQFVYQRVSTSTCSDDARVNSIEELELLHPTLYKYIRQLHAPRYNEYKNNPQMSDLLRLLYHFFIYDFTCRFKSSDMLWCLPFFERGVFDVYGRFHGYVLIRDFELFSKNESEGY